MTFPSLIRAKCVWCEETSHHGKLYNDEWYCPTCYERVRERDITGPAEAEKHQATQEFLNKMGFKKSI